MDGKRRTAGTPLFSLAGFDVSMNFSWLVIAFLVTWTLAAGVFPGKYPGLSTSMYWIMGIALLRRPFVLHRTA